VLRLQMFSSLIGDHEARRELMFRGQSFERMTHKDACDYIDDHLAEGMRHVIHSCGQVLLEANSWWSGMGPYGDMEWGFYLVPLHWGSKPVRTCPGCGKKLDLEGVGDNEELEKMDEEEFEEIRPTVLPRVTDIL
jgi:hypothetical protein